MRERRCAATWGAAGDWVFGTRNGTPLSQRSVLTRAARNAGLDDGDIPPGKRETACVQAVCDGARGTRTPDLLGAIQALCFNNTSEKSAISSDFASR